MATPERRIVGFHRDAEAHWVADLECGHGQHVRHDPPWQERPWVLSDESRARFVGTTLRCVRCEADELPDSARRVQQALADAGLESRVVVLPQSARTAADAAAAIGCRVEQIAKSLVFRVADPDRALLVIASGRNRVDERRAAAHVNGKLGKADAAFVRAATGFAIGGVPPLGHDRPIETLIDEDLLRFDTIWAAAGTPHAVFSIRPQDLVRATGGRVVAVAA
jgi:prolyl-tRNA editing enzyme YbaK/EbsC (Cys-tRNA(Pro) deacylase)